MQETSISKTTETSDVRPLIMIIDDEQQNLNVLSAVLEPKYRTICCLSGAEAIKTIDAMANQDEIAAIISDQRMPKMTGVQFFENIIEKIPDTVRMILTAYTDTNSIVDSINKANIYKFITKPFDPPALLRIVDQAVELYSLRLKVKEGDKLKREFISTVSHELRTPMNGIQGSLDLLKTATEKKDFDENIRNMEKSINHLSGLIESIINFTVFESGDSSLSNRSVNFNEAFQDLIDEYRGSCERKGIEFSYEKLDSEDIICIDIDKIKKIVGYLLANAVMFTDKGKISLKLDRVIKGDDERIEVIVEDTGIGIDSRLHKEIFKLFTQADASYSREYGGLGIGLAITKQLLDLFEGSIDIESTPGQGSRFTVIIPIKYDQYCNLIEVETFNKVNDKSIGASTILIVEDNLVNQQILKSMLEKKGAHVYTTNNGLEAISWCEDNTADLIFMDCQMPKMDGIEATKKIRTGETTNKKIPIIAVTANVAEYDKQQCLQVGMDLFLTKPLKQDVIYETLEKFLADQ